MKTNPKIAENPIFEYYPPKGQFMGILSIPHSGEIVPKEFKEYLSEDLKVLMQDVDFRVHELVDINELQNSGIAIIKSNIIRTAIDLNRPKDKTLLNWKQNSKGKQVVLKEPDQETNELLTEKYYAPYYEMLKTLIDELRSFTSKVSIVDLHSMPSQAEEYHLKINPNQEKNRPDFCISDISGKSCEKEFIDRICNLLNSDYSNITQNNPYFGGHITRHLDANFTDKNNIQIEICRRIYMDETKQELTKDADKLKPILTKALQTFFNEYFEKYKK